MIHKQQLSARVAAHQAHYAAGYQFMNQLMTAKLQQGDPYTLEDCRYTLRHLSDLDAVKKNLTAHNTDRINLGGRMDAVADYMIEYTELAKG